VGVPSSILRGGGDVLWVVDLDMRTATDEVLDSWTPGLLKLELELELESAPESG